jgi:hypothetical protein
MPDRQQVLHLWLVAAALDTSVSAWAFYDGTDGEGPPLATGQPPYRTGVDALRDGWFLLQAPGPVGDGSTLAETGSEFVFVRTVSTGPG